MIFFRIGRITSNENYPYQVVDSAGQTIDLPLTAEQNEYDLLTD